MTTKANGNAVDVFGIDRLGGPSPSPATTVLPDAVPFAVAFDAHGNLALAEAGPNAVATFTLDRRGALSKIAEAPTGQAATCWIVNVGGRLYVSNAGSGTVSVFDGALARSGSPPRARDRRCRRVRRRALPLRPDRRRRRAWMRSASRPTARSSAVD